MKKKNIFWLFARQYFFNSDNIISRSIFFQIGWILGKKILWRFLLSELAQILSMRAQILSRWEYIVGANLTNMTISISHIYVKKSEQNFFFCINNYFRYISFRFCKKNQKKAYRSTTNHFFLNSYVDDLCKKYCRSEKNIVGAS